MKNTGKLAILIVITSCTLTGCHYKHTWTEATCTEPKTCSVCGETEGESLGGHIWVEATCTEPKTCSRCGETEGKAIGHTWVDVTCTEARHCIVCGETEGQSLGGHTWVEATCENPKTCSRCGKTEGEVLEHKLDETGKCTICGDQIGTILTASNAADYLKISVKLTGERNNGYPIVECQLTALKNVKYYIRRCKFQINNDTCPAFPIGADWAEDYVSYGNPVTWPFILENLSTSSIWSVRFLEVSGYVIE